MSDSSAVMWIITDDKINDGTDGIESYIGYGQTQEDFGNDVIRRHPADSRISSSMRFRLLDDDGIVYYIGHMNRAWFNRHDDPAYNVFKWAMCDSGCTDFQIRNANHEWESIYA